VSRLRVGVIGMGVGLEHVASYEAHPACSVTTLCDFSPERLKQASALHPGKRLCDDAYDVLTDPRIDVVSIASYDGDHAAQVLAALKAGKHVFVEKPLCLNADEAREIRRVAGLYPEQLLSSNLVLRSVPRFRWLKQQMEHDVLGRVFAIEGDYLYGRFSKILSGWRGKTPGYSGVLGGGIHLVDLMLWITGDRVQRVVGFGSRIATQAENAAGSGSNFQNYDHVAALLLFRSGMVGKLGVSLGCVHPHFHRLSVFGTRGTYVNGRAGGELFLSRDRDADVIHGPADDGWSKADLIHSFLNAILDGGQPAVTLDEVLSGLSVCFAVEQSAHEGKTVAVDYV